jgi:hypothetical protein
VLGVALLLLTPDQVFNHLVPYLLLLASLALFFQPRLSRWHEAHIHRQGAMLGWGLFVVSVYSGYFGAGSGIMALALILLTVDPDFARANALKNMILGVATLVAALGFLLFGPVHLEAALCLGVGCVVGSFLGPSVARTIPGDVLRVIAAAFGVGLAVWFFVHPGS